MFWNGKVCIFVFFYVHLDLFYVLDYSGSFDTHIEKLKKKSAQNRFCRWGGGQKATFLFYDAFP